MALLGASAAIPARAQESIWDMFARNRVLREADTEGASQAARQLIATPEPILSYDTAQNLQFAISQYEPFVAAGGWEEIPREVYGLRLGHDRKGGVALKRRLMSSADMPYQERVNEMIDEQTDAAIRLFQARHGLQLTGEVDEATFYAMAVPAGTRLQQLYLNLQRVNNMAPNLSDRYVNVNIPAATIEAVEGGMVVQRHIAVVGRVDRATPILESKIHQINFNPYWHVPTSIIRKDLIPYMNKDPQYLTNNRIHIFDGNGNEILPTQINWQTEEAVNYLFRQEPGAENSMGHVKINFHNPHNVYLHDTPSKALFGENARFHSSGCVRVEGVQDLVAWLLRDNGWDPTRVSGMFSSAERLDVSINNPVPIHTTYITAWANRNGTVSFRDDVYNFDSQGRVAFEA
ncbi:amidase [Devosia pacifica]|uniref:Amidase n=2 Tax=Devosia pacifica TaxID=1335967 RepID=A0A918SFG2_9HYPH|nr:amidase [Devosia pacifica]